MKKVLLIAFLLSLISIKVMISTDDVELGETEKVPGNVVPEIVLTTLATSTVKSGENENKTDNAQIVTLPESKELAQDTEIAPTDDAQAQAVEEIKDEKELLRKKFLRILFEYGDCIHKRNSESSWFKQPCYCGCRKELAAKLYQIESEASNFSGPLPQKFVEEETQNAILHFETWQLKRKWINLSYTVTESGDMPSIYARLAEREKRHAAFLSGYLKNKSNDGNKAADYILIYMAGRW